MAITQLSKLYAVRHNTTLIEGIVNQQVTPEVEHFLGRSDGQIDLGHVSVRGVRPALTFTTQDIAVALGLIGMGGLAVSAAADAGLKMFFRQAAEGGGNATGNTALKLEMLKGLIVPLTLDVEQGGEASLNVMAAASWDGTNDPLTVTDTTALQGTPSAGQGARFTLGPMKINGTAVAGVKRMRVNFGLDLFRESSDGELYPTWVGIRARTLELSFQVLARSLVTTGIGGVIQGATASVAYLRKKSLGGGLVANATAEHIAFTMLANSGRIITRDMGAQGEDGALTEVVWQPYSADGGVTAPMTVNTASAIS